MMQSRSRMRSLAVSSGGLALSGGDRGGASLNAVAHLA